MARRKVFISYSRKDHDVFEIFQQKLHYFTGRGLLDVFVDEDLEPGDDFHAKIQRAMAQARIAILLISDHFLQSKYVNDHELPELLRAAVHGEIRLIPVLVSPSQITSPDCVYSVVNKDGNEEQVPLRRFLAASDPRAKTLRAHPAPEREAEVVRISQEIVEIAKRELLSLRSSRTENSAPQDIERRTLWVQLERKDDGLRIRYATDTIPNLMERHVEGSSLVELDGYHRDSKSTGPVALGPALTRVLLGDESKSEPQTLIASAFDLIDRGQADPVRYPMRVRIVTRDPCFDSLPWPHAIWKGRPLIEDGWSFEVTPISCAPPKHEFVPIRFHAPCRVLFVQLDAGDEALRHRNEIKGLLGHLWPKSSGCLVVEDEEELEDAWRRHDFPVVYVFGSAREQDDRLAMSFAADPKKVLTLDDLQASWKVVPPKIVYVNLVGDIRPEVARETRKLLNRVPCVVQSIVPAQSYEIATNAALFWFEGVLRSEQRGDPIGIGNALSVDASPDSSMLCSLPNLVLRTSYPVYDAVVLTRSAYSTLALDVLDRTMQRAIVTTRTAEFAKDSNRRALAILGAGSPGNHVAALAGTLIGHVNEKISREVELEDVLSPSMTSSGMSPGARFRESTLAILGAAAGDSIGAAIRRWAARETVRRRKTGTIPFVHWEPVSGRSLDHLEREAREFLRFCSDDAAAHLSPNQRVVFMLPFEVDESEVDHLEKRLHAVRDEDEFTSQTKLAIEVLPRLSGVVFDDIKRFVQNPQYCSVDSRHAVPLAREIFKRSRGEFAEAVRLLDSGARYGWHHILPEIEKENEE